MAKGEYKTIKTFKLTDKDLEMLEEVMKQYDNNISKTIRSLIAKEYEKNNKE